MVLCERMKQVLVHHRSGHKRYACQRRRHDGLVDVLDMLNNFVNVYCLIFLVLYLLSMARADKGEEA